MKVAIITWHNYPNFGSALQAYALHAFINSRGGDATLVNYVPGQKEKLRRFRIIASYFDRMLPYSLSKRLHYRFLSFARREFRLTRLFTKKEQLSQLNNEFDVFICGSDQIWAPNVLNEVYLLDFVDDAKKKISYAASIGLPVIPEEKKPIYQHFLSRFSAIALREEQGAELLKNEFGIEPKVVLDPTLLLRKTDWEKIMRKNKLCKRLKGQYILCYFLGQSESHRKLVEEVAKSTGLKVIALSRFAVDSREQFIVDSDAGPREFLGYIHDAALVITDSFHGLCFSINLNKNFYVVKRFSENDPINQNSRILNILSKVNLTNRLIDSTPSCVQSINYSEVNQLLDNLREYSIDYLIKNKIIN